MADENDQRGSAIAPPLVVLICIAGGILLIVVVAAFYRICRTVHAGANDDIDGASWNPNNRNPEQTKYMEEVRWRNNAYAWEAVRKDEHQKYRKGWYKEWVEQEGAKQNPGTRWTPSQEISAEEFLSHVDDNPYQGLLERRQKQTRPNRQSRLSPVKRSSPIRLDEVASQAGFDPDAVQHAVQPGNERDEGRRTDVRITVNDESGDIVDAQLPMTSKFPPRQSRMLRASSVYSGDALLPSNHLHLVQSSSKYGLGDRKGSTIRKSINDWERRSAGS